MINDWSPTTPLILAVAGGSIYAINDLATNGGKQTAKIMIASVIFGFVASAIDDVTRGPIGTGITALFLFAAFMSKGAPAFVSVTKVVSNVKTPTTTKTKG